MISHGHLKNLVKNAVGEEYSRNCQEILGDHSETDFVMRTVDKLALLSLPLWKPLEVTKCTIPRDT